MKPDTVTYGGNHLAACLRTASVGRDGARFAEVVDAGNKLASRTVTYGELFSSAQRIAAALTAAGLTPDDRVAVQVEKSLGAVQLYLGVLLAGGVFLPFNPAYTAAEMNYFLGDSQPAIVVCDPGNADALRAACDDGRLFTLAADGTGTLRAAMDDAPREFNCIPRDENSLAAILYTSGTTGRAKGAMLTHGNLASNAMMLTAQWEFCDGDVLIHALPIFHTHGLFVAIHCTLIAGASLIFLPAFNTDTVIAALPRATVLMGVPTFYVRLLDHPKLTREVAAGMRLFVSGSAPLSPETHARWREKTGHAILERYGMTETGMNIANPYHGERRAGTVGLPLPGVEMNITDPHTGATIPRGEVGVIEVRGANVFRGYWRMPDKTRDELRADGFFVTGDLATANADGYISIVGRRHDLIISGGYNVYPREIENRLDDIAGVCESAVIGLPHADFGECVAAVVAADETVTEKQLRAALTARIAKFKQPTLYYFTDKLPRNAMGKIQKNVLREIYRATK